jgi:sodium/proline symporter
MAFTTGLGALWIIPGTVLAFLFNWLLIGQRLRRASLDHQAITLTDVFAAGHQGRGGLLIRVVATLIILSMLTAYVAAQFNAAGKMFASTLGWSYPAGVLAGAAIVLAYTTSGGFRAVAWTDVVQALFMVAAMLVLPIVLLVEIGGPGAVWNRLQELEAAGMLTDPFAGKAGLGLIGFFSVWLGIPLGYPGQPHILVRFMAAKDERAIRRGTVIATTWVFLLFTGAVVLGITARAVYGTLPDPETVLPVAAADSLPGMLAGVVIAAVLAAICSTADSQLLVSASALGHDLWLRILGQQPAASTIRRFNRLVVLAIGIVAMLIALGKVRVIFDFVLYAWAGLGAAFGPALILTLMWRRTSASGVIGGMVAGFATAMIWPETPYARFYELVPAFGLAFCAVIMLSLLFPGRPHTRVRP